MVKKFKFLVLLAMSLSFISCFPTDNGISDKVNIVCTIFPQYSWVENIVGNSSSVTYSMVVKNGVDLHSFQPSATDIVQISSCDIFIYIGGPSDAWVDEVLAQRKNKDMKIINLMNLITLKEEAEALESDENDCDDEIEYDEHIWLSFDNTEVFVKAISDAIIEQDPNQAEYYQKRTTDYIKELNGIKEAYQAAVSKARIKTLVFCDRFPFRYLMDELGLDYIAAFPGCSTETDASFETVTYLVDKVRELDIKALVKLEGSSDKLTKTVLANSKYCDIVTLDSMQSVSLRQAFNGKTYTGIMRSNLDELKKALK